MKRLVAVLATGLAIASLPACRDSNGRSIIRSATAVPTSSDPELEPRDCGATDLPREVDCYWLPVPMDRNQPDGPEIQLAVEVLRSPAPDPAADPVVFLQGGPGYGSVGMDLSGAIFLASRDLVLFDQRGTGLSEPRLDCPERVQARLDTAATAAPFDVELDEWRRATLACRDRLRGDGVDLEQFNSESSAADLADLRVALGVDGWNLWATSYGTRLALTTMRSHPEGIRSVILDSVYPPTVSRLERAREATGGAFDEVAASCERDPTCAAAVPDVAATIEAAVAQLDANPLVATATLPDAGTIPLTITGADTYDDLIGAVAAPTRNASVPAIARDVTAGRTEILPAFAQQLPFQNARADGAFLSIECADSARRLRQTETDALLDEPGELATYVLSLAEPYCDEWGVAALGESFNRRVSSDIPTLVLAGSFDPLTPPSDSRAAAGTLANATYVEFEGLGHTPTLVELCAAELSAVFVVDPDAPVDTACAEGIGPRFDL